MFAQIFSIRLGKKQEKKSILNIDLRIIAGGAGYTPK